MAMATPVVAASQVGQALQAVEGHDILFATQPEEYASTILSLLSHEELAQSLGRAGRRYVEQSHNWDKAAERLEQIYRWLRVARVTESDVDRLLQAALQL